MSIRSFKTVAKSGRFTTRELRDLLDALPDDDRVLDGGVMIRVELDTMTVGVRLHEVHYDGFYGTMNLCGPDESVKIEDQHADKLRRMAEFTRELVKTARKYNSVPRPHWEADRQAEAEAMEAGAMAIEAVLSR